MDLKFFKAKAAALSRNKKSILHLVGEASHKAETHRGKIKSLWDNMALFLRLTRAWAAGEYQDIPWKSVIAIVAGILYFVNPLDLIPDFTILGFSDDAVVIAYLLKLLKEDLEKFKFWEKHKPIEVKASS